MGRATSWASVFAIYGAGVAAAVQLGKVPPAAVQLRTDFGLSLTAIGWAISVVTLVSVALGVAAGAWIEKVGGRRALLAGLAVAALAAAASGLAPNGTSFLAARVIEGIGYLVVVVTGPTLLVETTGPAERRLALAIWGTFVPVGIGVAQLMAAAGVDTLGWRIFFLACAGFLVAATLAVHTAVAVPGDGAREPGADRGSVYRHRPSILLALGFGSFTLIFLAVAGFLPSHLVAERGLTIQAAGVAAGLITAAGALGSIAAGWGIRRGIPLRAMAIAGLVVPAVAAIPVFVADVPLPLALVAATLVFAVGGLVPAAVFASVPDIAGGGATVGRINGLLVQSGSLGSLLGPPLFGAAVTQLGWTLSPVVIVAVAAAGVASLLALRPGAGQMAGIAARGRQ